MDQHFAREVAQDNLFEIQASQLAEQRAQSQDVKQFAQKLVQDHQQATQKLQQIAQSKGIDLPKELDEVHQAKLQKMQKLQGKHFEKHFVYGQVAGHVMDVLMFRDASQELKDNELKQFAAQTLPTLQQHLQMAERLANWNEAMPASATEHGTGTHGATPGDRTGTGTSGDRDRARAHRAPRALTVQAAAAARRAHRWRRHRRDRRDRSLRHPVCGTCSPEHGKHGSDPWRGDCRFHGSGPLSFGLVEPRRASC